MSLETHTMPNHQYTPSTHQKQKINPYQLKQDYLIVMYDPQQGFGKFFDAGGKFKKHPEKTGDYIGAMLTALNTLNQDVHKTKDQITYADMGKYKINIIHGKKSNAFILLPGIYSEKETKILSKQIAQNFQNKCSYQQVGVKN